MAEEKKEPSPIPDATEKAQDIQKEINKLIAEQVKLRSENKRITAEEIELIGKQNRKILKLSESLKGMIKLIMDSPVNEATGKLVTDLELAVKAAEDEVAATKKRTEAYKKLLVQLEAHQKSISNSLISLTGITSQSKTMLGQTIQTMATTGKFTEVLRATAGGFMDFAGAGNLAEGTSKKLAAGIAITGLATNLFTTILDKAISSNIEYWKSMEEANKSVAKMAGAMENSKEVLHEGFQATKNFGGTLQENSQAYLALSRNVGAYNALSGDQIKELQYLTVLLGEVGVDAASASKSIDIMSNALRLNDASMKQNMRELSKYGNLLGDANVAARGFESSMKVLAAHGGEKAIVVFKELALQAFATKTSIETLMSVAEKFSTFESAASSAAKLNAILGGQLLNSTELLVSSESERIGLVIKSIQQSGKAWSQLDRFEQKAIAAAAGISDMSEANKLLGQSYSEYNKGLAKGQEVLEQQKAEEERAKRAQTVMEKWTAVVQELIINFEWLVDGIRSVVDWFLNLNSVVKTAIYIIGGILLAKLVLLKMGLMSLSTGFKIAAASAGTAGPAVEKAGGSVARGIKSIGDTGAAGFKAAGIVALFGVVFIEMAIAAYVLAKALEVISPFLGKLLTDLWDNKGTIALFSVELLALGLSLSILAGLAVPMLIGAAALGVLGLALWGFLQIVERDDGLRTLISDLSLLAQNADGLSRIPTAITSIVDEMVSLNDQIKMLSSTIWDTLFDDLIETRLQNQLAFVGQLVSAYSGLTSIKSNLGGFLNPVIRLVEETNDLDDNKVKNFQTISESTVRIIEASKDGGDSEAVVSAIRDLAKATSNQTIQVNVAVDGGKVQTKTAKLDGNTIPQNSP